MRVKAVVGFASVWFGSVLTVRGASTTELTLSIDALASVLGGVLIASSGLWLIARSEELPEDAGETLVPRRWVWYSIAGLLAVSATIYTAELLDLLTV